MQYYDFDVIRPDLVSRFRIQNPPLFRLNVLVMKGLRKKLCIYIYIKKTSITWSEIVMYLSFLRMLDVWRLISRLKVDGHSIFQMHRKFIDSCVGANPTSTGLFLREVRDIAIFITGKKTTQWLDFRLIILKHFEVSFVLLVFPTLST